MASGLLSAGYPGLTWRSVTASTVYTLRRYVASFKSSKVNKVLVLRLLLFAMKRQANLIKEPGP